MKTIYSISEIQGGLFIKGIPVNSPAHAEQVFIQDGYTWGWIYRTQAKTWRLIVRKEEYNYVQANKHEKL